MNELRGTPDTDKLILLELDDASFTAVCSVSRYTRSLCDEKLWADRFALKYGVTLWQYGVSHRDAYIEFSRLKEGQVLAGAIKNGYVNLIEKLLQGATQDKLNEAFILASKIGKVNIVKLLLDKGADIHANNDAALTSSSANNNVEVVKLLLDNGADIHANKDAALTSSSANNNIEVVKLLLDNGVYSDHILRWVSRNGNLEIVKLIIKYRNKVQ